MFRPVDNGNHLRPLAIGVLLCAVLVVLIGSCGDNDSNRVTGTDAGTPDVDAEEGSYPDRHMEAELGWDAHNDVVSEVDATSSQLAWINDPNAWKEISGTEDAVGLSLWEAYPDRIGFPDLVWKSCGDGCGMAEVGQGHGDWGYLPSASTAVLSDEPAAYLQQTNMVTLGDTVHNIQRVIRLDDGVTVSTIRCTEMNSIEWARCTFGRLTESALATEVRYNVQTDKPRLFRGVVMPNAPFIWAQPVLDRDDWPEGLQEMDIEQGRSLFIVGLGAVRTMSDPTSSAITILEQPSASYNGVGQGDLAIWTDYNQGANNPPRIRGWAKNEGVRTIIDELPEQTTEIAISPTHLVGVMGQVNVAMVTARLWKTPRAYQAADIDLTTSPPLPLTPWYGPLQTWGDFAVLSVRRFEVDGGATPPTGEEMILIVQLSTWKVWRLDPPTGYIFHQDAVTLTPTHLYAGQKLVGVNDENLLRRILRFDLKKIDTWAVLL